MKKFLLLLLCGINLIALAQSGITWNMGMNISTSTYNNMQPRITLDATGDPLVIWGRMSDESVFFSRWTGTMFTTPVKLNGTLTVVAANWMGPDIASHGDTIYVVMKETPEADTASHIYLVHSYDAGMTFSSPLRVDNIADSISRYPTVTTDAIGNPVVGFMKFNPAFGDARWVVTRSNDFGNTFSTDVKASGWSSMTSTVCDCCPGGIASSGNSVTMLYRDNNSNIRDSWAGISNDGGNSFTYGINIDQNNWMLMACPSTGPDGVIIGDTLYSVFMNGASGASRTYFSKSSLSTSAVNVNPLTGTIPGLGVQNYPRIATDGAAMAIVWKQTVSGGGQLPVLFTNNIINGFPANYDTVDLNDITNADVAIANGNIFVVWEDDNSGTVKYRSGTFSVPTGITENKFQNLLSVYPNPVTDKLHLTNNNLSTGGKIKISNVLGEIVLSTVILAYENGINVSGLDRGIYFVKIISGNQSFDAKFIKQ